MSPTTAERTRRALYFAGLAGLSLGLALGVLLVAGGREWIGGSDDSDLPLIAALTATATVVSALFGRLNKGLRPVSRRLVDPDDIRIGDLFAARESQSSARTHLTDHRGEEADSASKPARPLAEVAAVSLPPGQNGEFLRCNHFAATSRLQAEIDALESRSRYSLLIGLFMATVGIIYVGISAWLKAPAQSFTELAVRQAPSASLLIACEVVAYFFLRIHARSSDETRFYRMQLVRMDAAFTVLALALTREDGNEIAKAPSMLAPPDQSWRSLDGRRSQDVTVDEAAGGMIKIVGALTRLVQSVRK